MLCPAIASDPPTKRTAGRNTTATPEGRDKQKQYTAASPRQEGRSNEAFLALLPQAISPRQRPDSHSALQTTPEQHASRHHGPCAMLQSHSSIAAVYLPRASMD